MASVGTRVPLLGAAEPQMSDLASTIRPWEMQARTPKITHFHRHGQKPAVVDTPSLYLFFFFFFAFFLAAVAAAAGIREDPLPIH